MGRRIPFPSEAHTSRHPSLVVFLVVAWIAAAMAFVLSFCATCNRKSSSKQSSPRSPPSNESVAKPAAETTPATAAQEQDESPSQETQQQEEEEEQQEEEQVTVIAMAPDVATHGPLPPTVLPASASKRKLSLSFGKVPERLRTSRRERHGKGNDSEDSLWKKTIILGEKNRISTDDEEEVVDENGNRQRHFHPKTPRSRQTSRNNSFAHPDETPS